MNQWFWVVLGGVWGLELRLMSVLGFGGQGLNMDWVLLLVVPPWKQKTAFKMVEMLGLGVGII